MSDARWIEVLDDADWAVTHFARAVEIDRVGGFEGDGLEAYKARMALLQAMQSGYTSLEGSRERILQILGEEKPVGAAYHADLVRRVSRDLPGERSALLDPELARSVDEARRLKELQQFSR